MSDSVIGRTKHCKQLCLILASVGSVSSALAGGGGVGGGGGPVTPSLLKTQPEGEERSVKSRSRD